MVDPKVVEAVLNEFWVDRGGMCCTRGGTALSANVLDSEMSIRPQLERARQAALGKRLLVIHAGARNGELSADDWADIDAIIRELRGES